MVFEGLQARITADSDDYQTSVGIAQELTEELGEEATEVGLRMAVMAERTDEAEDEVSQLARAALGASPAMNALSASTGRTTVSMLGLNTSVSLSATTLIGFAVAAGIAVTAIVSLVAAVSSLIAVAALLGGAGLIAFGQAAASRFEDAETAAEGLAAVASRLQSRVTPILSRLGRAFVPLFRSAVRAIPGLVRELVRVIGPLRSFTTFLRAAGAGLRRTLIIAVREAARVFRELRPRLIKLGQAFVKALPNLIQFGGAILLILVEATRVALDVMRMFIDVVRVTGKVIYAGVSAAQTFGNAIISFIKNPVDSTAESIDKLNDRLARLLQLAGQVSGSLGIPGATSLQQAGRTVAASRGATQAARPDPAATTSTGARRDDFVSRESNRSPRGADPDVSVEVRGDTEVVERVAVESGRQGAQQQLREEQRRVGDR